VLLTEYTAIGLTPGVTYSFRIQARNVFGLSVDSAPLQLLNAFIPAVALSPSTSVIADDVIVTWVAPSSNGSPITNYRIKIIQSDTLFSEDLTYCDGTDSVIIG
jgi:hypothetical protein